MTTETSITELAAEVIVDAHAIDRHEDESALQAFAWALGPEIDYEQGLREFADAIHGQLTAVARLLDRETAIGLIDAKIELLSEYKLEYPQDYAPDDIAEMHAEIARLGELRDQLTASPSATWNAEDPRRDVGGLQRNGLLLLRHAGGISSDAPA